MLALSQSFTMGQGNIEHNLRITKGAGIRQNGVLERRHLNEDLVLFGNKFEKNYVHDLIHNAVAEKIGDKLAVINEKHIAQKQRKRICSIDDWIEKQSYTRGDKKKKIISEYVVNIGNKYTACPYEIETDSKGNMIDVNGKIISEWDTRHTPAYKNGKIIESKICKKVKKVYRDFVKAFQKENPQAQVLNASVHCDEYGACHLHLSVLWWSKKKNDVGFGLAETTAIRQQYESRGIKCNNTRKDNATNEWRKEMRQLLREIAFLHGIDRLDMGNKEPHRSTYAFQKFKDKYCECKEKEYILKEKEFAEKEKQIADKEKNILEKQDELDEKEKELSKDIAKQEWYLLKKKFPDVYKIIHNEYKKKKIVNKGLDKENKCLYNKDRPKPLSL